MDDGFSESDVDYAIPRNISYSIEDLKRFCSRDHECVLTFYGGEPLLRIGDIQRIMDTVKVEKFMIQTNGLNLDQLSAEYVNRFHTILVSLDGDEVLTDYYRGGGTFRKVVDNLRLITKNGFRGELIARMTVMEQTDIYEQVSWLMENDEFSFRSIHWQLNAGFWNDFAKRDFPRWSEKYDDGVRKLAKLWVDRMESEGTVLRLYPFLGIASSRIFYEEENLLRCGGGWINYAIQTDGNIIPCPTMWGMKSYYVGNVSSSDPLKLRKIMVGHPCVECNLLKTCGGRCLYATVTKRWGPNAYDTICGTVRNLVQSIDEQIPRIENLIDRKKVEKRDFKYLKYNGCEIIP